MTTGAGTTIRTAAPFPVALRPGWNFVGNPFNFYRPLGAVYTQSGQFLDLLTYDGVWRMPDSLLRPFEGYIVHNALPETDTLWIDPDTPAAPGRTEGFAARKDGVQAGWAIRILARAGDARDTDTRMAVMPDASTRWDAHDRPEPPFIGDYLSVSSPHPEWERPVTRYRTDARPVPDDAETWPFEVRTRRAVPVELRFEGLAGVPPAYAVHLVDDLLSIRQDLRERPRYVVVTGGGDPARVLKLVVERKGGQAREVPGRYVLFQNFPNPFRAATTIRYGVPATGRVSLTVYDVMGRRVVEWLHEVEREAGCHAVVWDGSGAAGMPVASGLYFVRMRAGTFTKTRRLVLIR